jgi:iron(III) transport system substrate-binding protein
MKAFVKIMTFVLLAAFIAGCSPAATPTPTQAPVVTNPTAVPPTEIPLTANEQWAKDNGLGIYDTGQDWAAIEAAAKQEGSVVIYSNSSRIADAATAFMALYPEINVEADDMGGAEVVVKVREEQQAGAYVGDVWFNAQGPDMVGEFIPNEWLWKFIPQDVLVDIPPEDQDPVVTHSTEVFGWIYNTELNDTCPISNWWELTNPEWKGKIFIKDPINSAEDLGMLLSFTMHTDDIAAAYQTLYGADWTTDPSYGSDTPNAGWLWIKKFTQNKPVGEPGSDDVWKAMATPGMTDNMMGWAPYSKYRNVTSGKAVFAPCKDLQPVVGLKKHNYVAVINQAPHPNAAKLFIRFALTQDGFAPWNQVGQFSSVSTIVPIPDAVAFQSLPTWDFDNQFVYDNIVEFRDFYAVSLLTNP